MPMAAAVLIAVAMPITLVAAAPTLTKSRVVTSQVKRQLGSPATFPTAKALMNRLVVATRKAVAGAGDGGPAKVKWTLTVKTTGTTATSSGSVTVRGLADDSVVGWTTNVTLKRLPAGIYDPARWRLLRADRRDICARGLSTTRARCR